MTRVRDPFVLALSLALLASAGALGVVLRHDGELGTVEDFQSIDAAGDEVRLKGDLSAFQTPPAPTWATVRAMLSNHTLLLDVDGPVVLVTGVTDAGNGADRIVDGRVIFLGTHPDDAEATLVVVAADAVYEPYFAW